MFPTARKKHNNPTQGLSIRGVVYLYGGFLSYKATPLKCGEISLEETIQKYITIS